MKKNLYLLTILALTTNILLAQVPSYVPTNGLVGYWPFNGNANDESGNGNNGTVNGATLTTDRFGNSSSAYSFDGDDWIEVLYNQAFNFGTNSFTLTCWALKEDTSNYQHLITRNYIPFYPNAVGNYSFRYNTNKIEFISSSNISTNNGTLLSPSQDNLSEWNHFVGVFNSVDLTIKIYMNGTIIASGPTNSNLQNFDSVGNMYFGVEHPTTVLPSGPQFLSGKIDDIGIWNRALNQQEITNLYNAISSNECLTMTINTGPLNTNPVTYTSTVNIYPNPANDQITIDCGNLANVQGWNIKITNMLGQEVFNAPMNTQQYVVPLNTWTGQGMYFVKIMNAQNEVMNIKKIILQ